MVTDAAPCRLSANRTPLPVDRRRLIGLIAVVVLSFSCSPSEPVNVLLITVDTLRADHLGIYGYGAATSPRIDALAETGVRFASCTVAWPKTWPSIAALLVGSSPRSTGVRRFGRYLRSTLDVLPEVFARSGYQTAAVVTNVNIGKAFNYDQGFETFIEPWREEFREQ